MSKRRRKTKKGRSRPGSAGNHARRQLSVSFESLEVARGHDGLLRGKPEPTLVLAAYRVTPDSAALVGRFIQHVAVKSPPPCVLAIDGEKLRYATRPRDSERFVLVVAAIESDSGTGVAALYSSLEAPEAFELWSVLEEVPTPRGLREWSLTNPTPPSAEAVHLLVSARHARDVCRGDDFLSACTLAVTAHEPHDEVWRLPFADESARNQWTATLRLRVV